MQVVNYSLYAWTSVTYYNPRTYRNRILDEEGGKIQVEFHYLGELNQSFVPLSKRDLV